MVAKKPGHQEEREVSRKTIRVRERRANRWTRGDYTRVLLFYAREAAGVPSTRRSPRPLYLLRDTSDAQLGVSFARGKAEVCQKCSGLLELQYCPSHVVPAHAGTPNHQRML